MRKADWCSVVLVAFAVVRIAATLPLLSATTDEPVHVSAGVELLKQHRYRLHPINPPLPRVVLAGPLVIAGVKLDPGVNAESLIGSVFYSRNEYKTNLVLARVGNLLFFLIAAVTTWWIARRQFGPFAGAISTLFFTTEPVILGAAGIANHDMAAIAGTALTLLAFVRWLDERTTKRAIVTGLAYGFSIGLRYSCLPFVPAACIGLYLARFATDAQLRSAWRDSLKAIPPVLAAAAFALWATFGFTVGSLTRFGNDPNLAPIAWINPHIPLPAPHFFLGIGALKLATLGGFDCYALGHWKHDGWWWYFPLTVLVKTTLASLLMLIIGSIVWRRAAILEWIAAALFILALATTSNFDIGIRYVLPIFVPLSIALGALAVEMLRHARAAFRVAAVLLIAWHCGASLFAHPEYLAYFNEIASRDPSWFLVDSNLDWGQDALFLRSAVRAQHIHRLGVSLVGMHDYPKLGFPPTHNVNPSVPYSGWLAVSEHMYRLYRADGGWRWLDGRRFEREGASIRLYGPVANPNQANANPTERVLLPIAGTAHPIGAPLGTWFQVDQSIRNNSDARVRVSLSACGTEHACSVDLAPHSSVPVATEPQRDPFVFVSMPKGTQGLAFSTTIRGTGYAPVNVPAIFEKDLHDDRVVLRHVPTNAGLNLRVWLVDAEPGAHFTVRVNDVVNEYNVDADGFATNSHLADDFPKLGAAPDVVIESPNAKVWAMMTTTDYVHRTITLTLPEPAQ